MLQSQNSEELPKKRGRVSQPKEGGILIEKKRDNKVKFFKSKKRVETSPKEDSSSKESSQKEKPPKEGDEGDKKLKKVRAHVVDSAFLSSPYHNQLPT